MKRRTVEPARTTDNPCTWTWDEMHDYYDTACGDAFQLMTGTPRQNRMKFCPHCGQRIKVKNT